MSTKKTSRRSDVLSDNRRSLRHNDDEIVVTLKSMQQKIVSSTVLNGGFDRLVEKVDNIENKVGSIHEAIYHPDEGLYARVRVIEDVKKQMEAVPQLEKDILTLRQQKELQEKAEKIIEDNARQVAEHAQQIKDLVDFKKRVNDVVKWVLVSMAGGTVTLLGKLLYNYLSGHMSVH